MLVIVSLTLILFLNPSEAARHLLKFFVVTVFLSLHSSALRSASHPSSLLHRSTKMLQLSRRAGVV